MIGLLPFTLFYVLLRGFYSLEDTRTPFIITIVFSALWLVLVNALFPTQPAGGGQIASIAFGYVVSYWVGLAIAWVWLVTVLRRRAQPDDDAPGFRSGATLWSLARLVLAGVIAFAVMSLIRAWLLDVLNVGSDRLGIAVGVVIVAIVGIGVYVLAAWLLRCREVGQAWSLLGRVLKRTPRDARVES